MNAICYACEEEKEGFEYSAYYGKVMETGRGPKYSDVTSRTLFLCDQCARKEARNRNKVFMAIFIIIGILPLIFILIGYLSPHSRYIDPYTGKDFLFPLIFFGVFLVPCYFLSRGLNKEPELKDGELEVWKILHDELDPRVYTIWTATSYKQNIEKAVLGQKLDQAFEKTARIHKLAASFSKSVPAKISDEDAVLELAQIYIVEPEGFTADDSSPLPVRIKEIGIVLNQHGGMDRMLAVHQLFIRVNKVQGAARNLEILWDGIGQWRG